MNDVKLTGGAQAWAQVQARAMSLHHFPSRYPSWRFDAIHAPLADYIRELRKEADLRSAAYNEIHQESFQNLIEQVNQLSLAGIWVQAQYERTAARKPPGTALVARLHELRAPALHALAMLEKLGRVSPEDAKIIRRGKGATDAAGDLQALVPLLVLHWDVIEALQAHMSESQPKLTISMLEEMPEAAAAYLRAKNKSAKPVGLDWHEMTRRLAALLVHDWSKLRLLNAGALVALDRLEEGLDLLPTILSIFRMRS